MNNELNLELDKFLRNEPAKRPRGVECEPKGGDAGKTGGRRRRPALEL